MTFSEPWEARGLIVAIAKIAHTIRDCLEPLGMQVLKSMGPFGKSLDNSDNDSADQDGSHENGPNT